MRRVTAVDRHVSRSPSSSRRIPQSSQHHQPTSGSRSGTVAPQSGHRFGFSSRVSSVRLRSPLEVAPAPALRSVALIPQVTAALGALDEKGAPLVGQGVGRPVVGSRAFREEAAPTRVRRFGSSLVRVTLGYRRSRVWTIPRSSQGRPVRSRRATASRQSRWKAVSSIHVGGRGSGSNWDHLLRC